MVLIVVKAGVKTARTLGERAIVLGETNELARTDVYFAYLILQKSGELAEVLTAAIDALRLHMVDRPIMVASKVVTVARINNLLVRSVSNAKVGVMLRPCVPTSDLRKPLKAS